MSDKYTDKQRAILARSSKKETAYNYNNAVDLDISTLRSWLTWVVDNHNYIAEQLKDLSYLPFHDPITAQTYPTGLSNCTLTATQWINPKQPIGRAQTIIDNGRKYGYVQIPEEYIAPGDLVIVTNPNNNHHHTMLVDGFTQGEQNHKFMGKNYILPDDHPLVRYSNGSTHPSGYRQYVGLLEYIDNSHGKTDIKYYRHYDPGTSEVLLPEIVVTPKSAIFTNNRITTNYRPNK